jgi:ketosteroid isomerase-like protein
MKLMITGLAAALVLTQAAAAQVAPMATAQDVATAERAFAADGLARGIGPSFVTWAAPDGIVLSPDPVNARAFYGAKPGGPPKPGAELKWWPVHAGIARSGDLAFDTGPWVYGDDKAHGWFLTVWKRQPDGSWRWLLDHGSDGPKSDLGPDTPLMVLPTAISHAWDAKQAMGQVGAEETRLNVEMADGKVASAYARRLTPDAWIAGLEPEPQMTEATIAAALAKRPQTISAEPLGGAASDGGDLAYTFGKATWVANGKTVEGRYVRVWQMRGHWWKLVFDEITPN